MTATTVYEKIEKLKDIKADLKTNIESYGVTVGTAPFDEYPAKVLEIPTTDSIKTLIDAVNEESGGATIQDSIDLVDSNYAAIKAAIEAKDVDMTGIKPSGYDAAIATIINASGDAVAADLVKGKTASNASGAITGTRPPAPVGWTGRVGESGVAWPNPRFTDNGDGTVTDNLTGLMWVKTIVNADITWANAFAACEADEAGGHTDWRMPTILELISLANFSTPATLIPVAGPFVGIVTTYGFWSSTEVGTSAWRMPVAGNFSISYNAKTLSTSFRYWPVRGPIAL